MLFPEKLNFWNVPRNFCVNVVQVCVAWFESSPAKGKTQKWCLVFYTNDGEKKSLSIGSKGDELWAAMGVEALNTVVIILWTFFIELLKFLCLSGRKHFYQLAQPLSVWPWFILYITFEKWDPSSDKSKSKSSLSDSGCSQPWKKLKIIVYICAFCAITVHSNRTHLQCDTNIEIIRRCIAAVVYL